MRVHNISHLIRPIGGYSRYLFFYLLASHLCIPAVVISVVIGVYVCLRS